MEMHLTFCIIFLAFLLSLLSSGIAQKCRAHEKLCGTACIGILDFCTISSSGEKCGRSRTCDDDTCVDKKVSCNPMRCSHWHKRCYSSGKCISSSKKCCRIWETECADGACLPFFSDRYCSCPVLNNFHCENKECVSRNKYCDGRRDCADGSDELDCSTLAPSMINNETSEAKSVASNTLVIFLSSAAGIVILIVFILCVVACSRRKPHRRQYWKRREQSFTQQVPTARTAETLVRNARSDNTPVPLANHSSNAGMGMPTVSTTAAVVSAPPYEHSAESIRPSSHSDPLTGPDNDIDLPPSYDEVIKNTPVVADTQPDTTANTNSTC